MAYFRIKAEFGRAKPRCGNKRNALIKEFNGVCLRIDWLSIHDPDNKKDCLIAERDELEKQILELSVDGDKHYVKLK